MASYGITYSCGHEGRETLTGKIADRTEYLRWAETEKVCPMCYRERLQTAGPIVYARLSGQDVELCIANSFGQREALKSRGYKFDQITDPQWPLGMRETKVGFRPAWFKAWCRSFGEPITLADELDWIDQQGWQIVVIDPGISGIAQSLGEGKRQLTEALLRKCHGTGTPVQKTI